MIKKILLISLSSLLVLSVSQTQGGIFDKIKTAKKFKQVKQLLQEKVKQGLNPLEITPFVKKAKKEFDKKNYDEAQKILSEAIVLMENFNPEQGREKRLDNSKINTSGSEDLPTISPDGKKLFFVYSPLDPLHLIKKVKVGFSIKDSMRIMGPYRPGLTILDLQKGTLYQNYVSEKKTDGSWSTPVPMDFPRQGKRYHVIVDVSDDGKEAILFSMRGPNQLGRGDLYISYKNEKGKWTPPENLGKPVNTKYEEDNGDLSSDGKVLFFDSDRPGGEGAADIWYSERKSDGSWFEPKNIGSTINSPRVEKFPFITKDQSRLYYASEYKDDTSEFKKDMRIFVSEKDSNGKWREPKLVNISVKSKQLGSPSVNDAETHLYFLVIDPKSHDFDIYYSEKQRDGNWGIPKPID